jgi:hypothetical protein
VDRYTYLAGYLTQAVVHGKGAAVAVGVNPPEADLCRDRFGTLHLTALGIKVVPIRGVIHYFATQGYDHAFRA